MDATGWFDRRRREQALGWMREALLYGLEQEVRLERAVNSRLTTVEQDVLEGRVSPFRAARDLLGTFRRR